MTVNGSKFTKSVPGNHAAQITGQAHASNAATEEIAWFIAPFVCRLKAVHFAPKSAYTGADTHYTNLRVVNKGVAGTGTAGLGTFLGTNGANIAASVPYAIVTGLTTVLAVGQVVAISADKVGSGTSGTDVSVGTWIFEYDGGS